MYISYEGQRLYLAPWNYNAARVYKELERLIIEKGGRVKPAGKTALITCRNGDENQQPIPVTRNHFISFVLGDDYYSYTTSDNPFFDWHYCKVHITDGKFFKGNAFMENAPHDWFWDSMCRPDCHYETICHAAEKILAFLTEAKHSEHYYDSEVRLVPNVYDGGYHEENIRKPIPINVINF